MLYVCSVAAFLGTFPNEQTLLCLESWSTMAVACNLIVLLLCRPEEIIVLLVAVFWRSDSLGNSTLLLQHLRQIGQHANLGQAASAFVCQLIVEACSHGTQPVISLQCLLSEVSALLCDLPCRHVQYSTAPCCPLLCCPIANNCVIQEQYAEQLSARLS